MSNVRIVIGNHALECDSSEKELIDRFLKHQEKATAVADSNHQLLKDVAAQAMTQLFGAFGASPPPYDDSDDEHLDS